MTVMDAVNDEPPHTPLSLDGRGIKGEGEKDTIPPQPNSPLPVKGEGCGMMHMNREASYS